MKKAGLLVFLCISIGIIIGIGWNVQIITHMSVTGETSSDFHTVPGLYYSGAIPSYDYIQPISCTSNSMGPIIQCGSYLYISKKFEIKSGSLYTFKYNNDTYVHRLITCLDDECSLLLFKGDTNSIPDDPVSIYDVIGKVVLIKIP